MRCDVRPLGAVDEFRSTMKRHPVEQGSKDKRRANMVEIRKFVKNVANTEKGFPEAELNEHDTQSLNVVQCCPMNR